jgi:hypothetical protein
MQHVTGNIPMEIDAIISKKKTMKSVGLWNGKSLFKALPWTVMKC